MLGFDAVKYSYVDHEIVVEAVGKCHPIPEQECFGRDITTYLNRVLPLDGSWRCVLTKPKKEFYDRESGLFKRNVPTMIELQWQDRTGRTVFVVEIADDIHTVLEVPYSKWADDCLEAYKQTRGLIDAVGVSSDQMLVGMQQQANPNILPSV